ncbi:MAG: Asp-tRNA(Asn)/Glu-tRNA(Gln) amidotransferase subunit GatC [Gemmatimonadetes bacterium]|nr:Asp-tRNA(Asn)/Glu-tRNA(Gln) amidotransferase subunit GatC [Gemmatimonadota bacterium]
MAVTRADVDYIAGLARLRLTEEEAERMTSQLNSILEHMQVLRRVDVTGVEGVGGMAEWPAPFRAPGAAADVLRCGVEVLSGGWADGFFVVPRLPAVEGVEDEE